MIKYFLTGFFTKIITGLDDTLTQIPIVSYITKTKSGKIAFAMGILISVTIVILLSAIIASFIEKIEFYRYIVSGLMILLALIIYFEIFNNKDKKTKKRITKAKKIKPLSNRKFIQLILFGFIASFTTIIDDTIAFSSILAGHEKTTIAYGIFIATLLEITAIITFSKKINKFKYKKEISSIGLILISLLVFFNII